MAIVIDGKFKPADPLGLYSRKANPLGASPVARTAYNPLEGNPDNEFNTPLTLEEERAFQAWKAKYRPDDSGEDYDLRGAFKAGLTPDPSSDHFPDTFKKPNHPTFSTESRYAQFAAEMAGSWDEAGNYVPSEARARRDAEATAAAETLQAQATYAELEEQSPGRYRLISEAEWDRWKANWDKANRSTGLVGDTIKLLDSGVAGLEQSINEIVGQIPVIGKPLQELADAFDKFAYGSPGYAQRMQQVIDRNVATLTPEMEQARGEVWWNEDTNSLGGAWLNPRSYFAGAVESLPSMAATMAPAMWLARGAYLGAIAKGATERVAAAAAAKTAMVAGAVTEGSLGGAETALAVKERIQAIPREKLLEAGAVKALIAQGMSEDAALEAITSDAATQAFLMGGVATGLFGGFGDRFLAKLISEGVGGAVAKRVVQGAVRGIVSEGLLEELPQEALGQLSQNMALRNTVSPEQDLGEGVLNAAMGGAAIGGVMGAGIGGVGGAARPASPVPAPDSGDEVIASGSAPLTASPEQGASAPTPKGPLASAVDYGLANGVDAPPPMAPVAATTEVIPDETPVPVSPVTEDQAPTAGANVVVEAEGLPRFVARLEGYTQGPTGPEALVIDTSTGEELQVPLAALRTAKLTDELVEQMDAPPPVDREPVSTPDDVTRILHDAQMVLPDATHARLFDLGDKRKRDKGFVRTLGDDALKANELYEPERRALADELQIPLARVNELADDYRYRVERAARAKGAKELPRNMHAVSTQLLQRFQIERLKAEKKVEEERSAPLAPLTSEEEQAIFSKAQAEMDETNFPDVADDFAEQAVVAARLERLKQIEDAAEAARDAKPVTKPTDRAKSIADKYLPLDEAANEAATSPRNDLPEPTQAQKEAGNYKLGHIALGGLNISIENPAGSERKGTDKGGKAWSVQLKHHYGYIKGTVGRDKDHIDVFVKEGVSEVADDAPVFVVDQMVDGEFDEHKVMLGFKTLAQARNAYKANYAKGWKGLGAITQTTLAEFKAWTRDGDTSKQFARAAEPMGGVEQQAPALEASTTQPADMTTEPAPAASAPLGNATAPEHVATGVDDRELGQIVAEFKDAQSDMMQGEHPVSNIFQPPKRNEVVRLGDKVKVYHKDHGWMTPAEARRQIEKWRAAAIAQGEDPAIRSANSNKVVLSLFDLSGKWSEPWEAAGYQVYRFDIQDNPETGDVNNFSAEFFGDWFGDFDGQEIYAVLAACPCTDFAVSGARHFAAKDADGRTVASVKLVQQTLRVIEYFKPAVWAVENPVGRIEKLGGLPPWRLSFDPNHLGDPYTKKTLIWGRFNADLPIAPVEPTEGSKMWAKYGGKSMATKNARSETPEGFAYGFFAANNAHQHQAMAVANKFDRLERGLIEKAIDAGVTPEQITSAVEDFYYMDLDDEAANDAIRALMSPATPPAAKKATPAPASAAKPEVTRFARLPEEEGQHPIVKQFNETFDWLNALPEADFAPLATEWGGPAEIRRKLLNSSEPAKLLQQMKEDVPLAKQREAEASAPKAAATDTFAKNKLFTADKVEAARARLKSKMGQLNSGIDPEVLVDGMTIAGAYIEAGVRDFADYARKMADDFGPRIRPYLLSFWEGARNYPGLDTKGMTPPAESARLHAELNTELPAEEAPALGQELAKPKKRTPKTGRGGDRTLIQDFGVEHIDGWTEGPNGEGEPTDFGLRGGVKDHFLKDATGYLQAVSSILHDQGWAPAEDNKGRPMKAVSKNEAGPAVSGDVSLTLFHPETSGRIHVTVTASSLRGTVPSTPSGVSIMFRTGVEMDRFASRATNQWAPVDLSAADFAKLLQEQADRAARFAKPGEASAEDRQRVIEELKGAIARPSLALQEASDEPTGTDEPAANSGSAEGAGELRSPGEPRPQRDPAPQDRGDLAAGESADVAPAADRRSGRAARKGAAAADVGGNGPADLFGQSSDGRARAGRERASDARAGDGATGTGGAGTSVEPVKAPAAVSPANRGPGNFHIEDPLKIVGGGQVARFEKNRRAIELANTLRDEGRQATREEQEILAGYTGWGSFGQDLFQGTWAQPRPKAGWEARDTWLRENLGQQEWESLQRSITNAHYTDPPTVLAMWDMVKRMGFGGGRVLEPSMGIGNFFGMMPVELANRSSLSGIELEQVTGEMAKLLYPDANISIMGYQSSKTPDDFYDLVIGNWPFEDTVIADRRYNKFSPFLHDYFYLKALDQVRPGGIVMGITSKGTMDKKESVIRTELAKKGELVAAFRLPSGAFEEYAGTNVVTDIIILRKRPAPLGSAADAGWIKSVPYRTPAGEEVSVNEYFVEHPDHVIGTIDFGHGTTFRRPGLIVHRPADMMGQLERIKALVPEGAYRPERREALQISYITNHTDDREGALVSTKDGLFIVRGEHMAPANEVAKYELKDAKATAQRVEQLTKLIDMRRAYAALIAAERSGTGDPEAARKTLKEQYDSFVSSHGPISESYGLSYLSKIDDPFYPALAALEQRTDKGPRPAQILSSSTIRGKRTIDKPSIADAFVLARNTSIDPSLAEIAKLAGRPEAEVRAELIDSGAVFETPAGDIVPSDIYLSGNVREKMRQARAGLDAGNAAMQRNIDALAKVIPPDVPYYSIEVQMGASWVPTHVYADYVAHMLNAGSSDGIAVTYTAGRWRITLSDALKARPEASAGFGTAAYRFQKLVNAAISNQTVTIRKEDSDGNVYVDQEATQEVNEKIANIRGGFGDWLWSDPERRVDLEAEYNEVRNAYASPSFDGSFLTFEGMALSLGRGPFDLREHQVNAIWRALVTRRSLNAHEVGTGKTFTMGGIAVESRRYGIARKPLIFAHNANSASVAAEIQQMYPAAKVLYIDNLAPAQIDVKMRQIANDDWDAIVVPHSLISRFALTEETLMAQAAEEIAAIEAEAYAAAADDGSTLTERMLDDPDELKKLRSPTAKDLVKTRNRIIENIKKQGQRASKEGAIPFEELGVDMVLVDEAHEFKKPPFSTRMRIKGLNTQSSDRSIALSFLLRYIRSTQNGGNVHLFTGTPVTNTLTEVFHMMRYIMAEEMSAVDVDQWDGWFGSFAREVQDVELNAAAEYEAVNRLAGFINVPELRRMIGQYMDVVFASDMPEMQPRRTQSGKTLDDKSLSAKEQAELLNGRTEGAKDRPYKKVIVETADLTPYQQQAFREIQRYAQRWRNFNGKEKKEAMLAGAPESPIIYENLAAKASFDVRLMRGEDFAGKEGQTEDDPNSKASRVVRNVLEIYNSSPLATQVVFTNAGLSSVATRSTGATGDKSQVRFKVFSTVQDIVERLVQQGVPRDQIAIVDGSTSKERRKEVADAMNLAKIRVVIGSTQSLGVGVNMQRNLRAMHHMDAPWMPGDLEQRNGRGLRQGNQWNTVLEYRYLTDRIDGRRWQVLAIKQRFINAFLRADDSTRVIEGDAASEEESDILTTFAEAAGDPRVLIRAKLRKKIDQLLNRRRMHDNGVVDARRSADRLEKRRTELEAEHKRLVPIAEKADALSQAMAGDGFRLKLGKQEFDKRGDAREAIDSLVDGMADFGPGAEPRVIGEFGGYPLRVEWPRRSENHVLAVVIEREPIIGFAGSLQSLEATLRKYRAGVDEMVVEIREVARSAERLAAQAKESFHQQGDLARAEREFAALELDLAQNPVPPPAWLRSGAPVDTEIYWNREKHVVSGHRWNSAGWFVLTSGAEGPVEIPYLEASDEQGMQLYEERPFVAPEVVEKASKSEGSPAPAEDGDAVADIAPAGRAFHAPRTEAVIDEIANSPFGEVVANLMEMGRVRIVAGAGSRAPSSMAMAWTEPDGRITLNASLIEPGEAVGVLLHEAFHSGAERLIGSKAWTELQAELQAILKQFSRGNGRARQFYDAARDRIARAREEVTISDALAAEELAAYAIEEYETAPKVLRDWIDKLVGVVKAWLLRRFGRQLGAVTPSQLREVAAMALRDAVGGTSSSQRASILPAWPNRSETFKRWFGDSKVVDHAGKPLVVYHGTRARFEAFYPGAFFTESTELAAGYGDRLVAAYLSIKKPATGADVIRVAKRLPEWDSDFVDEYPGVIFNQIRGVQAALESEGYDGAQFDDGPGGYSDAADAPTWVAFRPEQIKSVENGGGFNPNNPNIRASIKAPKPAEVKASAKGTWTDVQPHLLATVPLTYFTELARPNMSAVDQYLKVKRQMDAYRGELHAEADALAQEWLKFSRLGGLFRSETGDAQTAALARLMHDATLAGVDPSKTDEETRKLAGYDRLREQFLSLPAEGQRLFVRVRDAYAEQARELDDLIIASVEKAQKLAQKKARETYEAEVERIRSSGLKGLELKEALDAASDRFAKDNIRSTYANKARATKLRQQFENNRVPTPYFPLARFGRYTVTVRDQEGAVVSFSRRERAADNTRLAEEMKAAYPKYTVETGVIDEAGAGFRDAMDPRIVADIQKILGDSGVDSSVMDAIWQRYLQSMPDLSTRKRFIHRKGTAGFEGDALRAFSSHMFHASHQMARLKHGLDLQEMLDQAAIQARKSDDPIRGGTLVNELGKRHKWVMNPTGSSAVQAVTSAMFVWYLGLTPAAALVNLTQTPMLGVPIIGARFGVAKTAAALLQASRDFVAGKADMRKSPKITAEEREILNRFYESGLIDRTQSHELAGVGDTGVRYSALRSRIMGVISWAFHKTEVANREVTALAAYRLARRSGLSVQAALDAAHDLTWKVHFDYSNSSRPRLLQGDAAKLLLVFQNYQLNMWYRLSRDLHQALKGETPQGRREARYQLAGMVGMMTLLGGVSGLFGFHVLMSVLGLFLDDRDDPYSFEEEMRRNTLDLFGPDIGGMILNGVPGHLLKIDLTSRIGMPDLFVRTPENASVEGRDWWQEMIVNALGVVPSTIINVGDGFGLMADGNMVRGIELMMPKAFKDVMQAYRFANEGLTTRRGDEIRPADQFSAYDFVIKAMGFTPAAVAETYDRNSALMNAQTRVMDRRQMLLNQYALALQNGDEVLLEQALERIKAFNAVPTHRGVRITRDTVRRSLAARRRNAEKREDGVLIQNDQLSRDLRALQPGRVAQ